MYAYIASLVLHQEAILAVSALCPNPFDHGRHKDESFSFGLLLGSLDDSILHTSRCRAKCRAHN